jgi:hypothetical protein
MNRSKIVAIVTGAISVLLAIAYLVLVQLLDFRGEMQPAPQSYLMQQNVVAIVAGVGSRESGVGSREWGILNFEF